MPRRRRHVSLISLFAAAVIFLASYLTGHVSIPLFTKAEEGQVVAVLDGDTIDVMEGGKAQRIRLYGIDCPEKAQRFGRQAKEFTSSLCFGKKVSIIVKDHDRYGRSVGEVTLPDSRNLNRELVKAGYAWWYERYSDDPSVCSLQREARRARLGLWADKNPVPPWDYREATREGR